jgi:AraC-like DNA-binding protein
MILFDQAGAGERRSKIMPPDPALKSFVEHLWVQKAPVPNAWRSPWRIVPDVNPQLIAVISCRPGQLKNVRCVIVGARSRFADISQANRLVTLGAQLHPGSLPLLTRLPASDFTDQSVSIEEVLGVRGNCLIEQLNEQRSAVQALHVLSQFLCIEFAGKKAVPTVDTLLVHDDRARDLAAALGLSSRTLYGRMKEQIGLAPKRLLRIRRIHRALGLCRDRQMSWAQISTFCGYADQAHLVREFQDLLGESPRTWQARVFPCGFVQDNEEDQGSTWPHSENR